MGRINFAKEVFDIEIKELLKVKDKLGKEFSIAIDFILESKGKVVVSGIGKSGLIGKKIASTLASTGTLSIFMNATEGLHGDLGMIAKEDVVIVISNSGNSEEIVSILPAIKRIGAKIIGMTGNKTSKLGLQSDVVLDIGVEKEACPMNLAPTSSTTATLIMGDAIASTLIKEKNFKPENFALYHPGGSLGRRLLLRVKDIMKKNDDLAILTKESTIEEVLLKLTEKKLGAVCINDEENLEGIITEGDIRRALSDKENFFQLLAKDIMTKNPISISAEKMAVDAISLMEERSSQISVLPVTKGKKLLGLIRIHDLISIK